MMTTKIATSPRLPNVINGGAGSPVRRASVPTAVSSGTAYGQKTPRATARSTPMRVPRKPQTIKGPWAMKRVGHGKGQSHPNRTSPPHSAVSKASMASAMRGKRTLLSIGNALCYFSAYRWVLPATGGCNSLVDLTGTPGTWLVFVHRCTSLQHRVDDAPGLFNIILSGKQGRISSHGVPEYPLVSIHLFCTGVVVRQQLHLLTDHLFLRVHHRQTKGARDLGTDAESEIVLRRRAGRKDRRRPAQADHDLRARYW